MTLVAYQVDCTDLVDLTQPKILAALNLTETDLACVWEDMATQGQEPPTWQLCRQVA
jgi:RES domain-containing protein